MLDPNRFRQTVISLFVILWCGVYHYMSVKAFYLEPLLKRPLPRVPMLFPPAGWIMFYNVGNQFGEVQVYGLEGVRLQGQGNNMSIDAQSKYLLDPHEIFRTRTIFFDNIKRGLMHGAVAHQRQFCDFLEYRFPYYDGFEVRYISYPDMTKEPQKRIEQVPYQCLSKSYINDNYR